jgi:hypothetical protein
MVTIHMKGLRLDFESIFTLLLTDNGIIIIHDTDSKIMKKNLLVSEDAKKDHHRFDGPSKFN